MVQKVIIEGGPVYCCEPYDIFVYGDDVRVRYTLEMACGTPGAERLIREGKTYKYDEVDLDRIEELCSGLRLTKPSEEPEYEDFERELLELLP